MICPYTAPQPPRHLQLACAHPRNDVAVLRPSGELDRRAAAHLIEFVSAHARGHDHVVLDMRRVSFLDAGGVRALLVSDHRARAIDSQLSVRGMNRTCVRITRLCGAALHTSARGLPELPDRSGLPVRLPHQARQSGAGWARL